MNYLNLLSFIFAACYSLFAQNDSKLYYKPKSNPTQIIDVHESIDANSTSTLALDFSIDPKLIEDVDGFYI